MLCVHRRWRRNRLAWVPAWCRCLCCAMSLCERTRGHPVLQRGGAISRSPCRPAAYSATRVEQCAIAVHRRAWCHAAECARVQISRYSAVRSDAQPCAVAVHGCHARTRSAHAHRCCFPAACTVWCWLHNVSRSGHNCFGAVLYPITMADFMIADVTDAMLDGVVAGFPQTYATKVGRTSSAMYSACSPSDSARSSVRVVHPWWWCECCQVLFRVHEHAMFFRVSTMHGTTIKRRAYAVWRARAVVSPLVRDPARDVPWFLGW